MNSGSFNTGISISRSVIGLFSDDAFYTYQIIYLGKRPQNFLFKRAQAKTYKLCIAPYATIQAA